MSYMIYIKNTRQKNM